ncbi:MAG TPA: hypothetical protein VFD13_06165, partial [Candidatus Kapabacteria bacterium]|nr:hypothetical protein [Candidatus Kapabacteria bacterium]
KLRVGNCNLPVTSVFLESSIFMKRVFAFLFFLILPIAPLGAQGLHGRIFILEDSGSNLECTFGSFLPSIYSGFVDSGFVLPKDLPNYDAIFVFPDGYDSIKFSDQISLIDYLKAGGRLYAETGSFDGMFFLRNPFGPYDTIHDPDTLWHFLGLRREIIDNVVNTYELYFGVDSEFTAGLSVPDSIPRPLPTYFPSGNFIPVLYGQEFEEDDIFAWIPSDKSIRAVMHYHPANISSYYAPFLTRVLCDYFGLCTDAVKAAPPSIPAITLRVVNDGESTSIVVSDQERGTLDIANAIGVTVYRASVVSGTSRIALPESLRNGVYFARLQTGHGAEVRPFAIVAK